MQANPNLSTTPPLPGVVAVPALNDALQTIATDFSGDTDPAALAWPLSKWANTSTGILYRRNAAGTAWVEIGRVLERPLYISDGMTGMLPTGGFRNKLINGLFAINQRAVSGTVVLTAGSYGHDRFKAGVGGCTYTFSTSNGVTTLNITAGTLVQEVEGSSIVGGEHVLSWQGTAQGRINTGSFGSSPAVAALAGGANVTTEFGIGTLSLPQLEVGSAPNQFEVRPMAIEMHLARRYYREDAFLANDTHDAATPFGGSIRKHYHIGDPMRIAAPTATITMLNWEVFLAGGWTAMAVTGVIVSSGIFVSITWAIPSGTPTSGTVLVRTPFSARVRLSAEL